MARSTFTFTVHPERLAIARLSADADLPAWARGDFVSISRTADELSIVCAEENVPAAVLHERGKIAFGIVGVVPMTTIGVLASLCGALAAVRVPVFVISTYDTDYLLVGADHFAATRDALTRLGHRCEGQLPR